MKITAKIAAMTLMAAMVGVAAEPKQPQQKLTVYLRENVRVPPEVRAPALDLANKMFATIGIRLDWRGGEPPRTSATRPIGIELAANTPANLLPGALGSARWSDCSGAGRVAYHQPSAATSTAAAATAIQGLTKASTSECSTTAFGATSLPGQRCLPMCWSTKSFTFFKGPTSIPTAEL